MTNVQYIFYEYTCMYVFEPPMKIKYHHKCVRLVIMKFCIFIYPWHYCIGEVKAGNFVAIPLKAASRKTSLYIVEVTSSKSCL